MIRDKILGGIQRAICGASEEEVRGAWEEIGWLRDIETGLRRDLENAQAQAARRGQQVKDLNDRIFELRQQVDFLGKERDAQLKAIVPIHEALEERDAEWRKRMERLDAVRARDRMVLERKIADLEPRAIRCSEAEEAREAMRQTLLQDRRDAQGTIAKLRVQVARLREEKEAAKAFVTQWEIVRRRMGAWEGDTKPPSKCTKCGLELVEKCLNCDYGQRPEEQEAQQGCEPQCGCAVCRFGVHEK